MSIIDDALKKAREERDRNADDKNKNLQPPPKAEIPKPESQGPEAPKIEPQKAEAPKSEPAKIEIPKQATQKIDIAMLKEKFNQRPGLFIAGGIMAVGLLLSITLMRSFSRPPTTLPPMPAVPNAAPPLPEGALSLPVPKLLPKATAPKPAPAETESLITEDLEVIDTSGFELTGVVHGDGPPIAVINGSVYMVGDDIKSARILKILQDTVILEKDGQKIEIKVR